MTTQETILWYAITIPIFIFLFWVIRKLPDSDRVIYETLKEKIKGIFGPTKKLFFFKKEWTWRAYQVLQGAGILGVIYLETVTRDWSFFPYQDYGGLKWHLFEDGYWVNKPFNWYFFLLILGPFFISKSLDWISEPEMQTTIRTENKSQKEKNTSGTHDNMSNPSKKENMERGD